jgi:hypothetical protein
MPQTQVGPTSIDQGFSGPYAHIHNLWGRRDYLVNKHQKEKERIRTVTNVVNGEWFVEWPDLTTTPEAPTVANIIEMGINHWAAVGGAILPSIRVPVNVSENRSQAKRGAHKRERRLRELWTSSNVASLAGLWWGDYAGTGQAVGGVWADFSQPDPAKRNPYLIRFDPRHAYYTQDNLGNITELLVARKISKIELQSMLDDDTRAVFTNSNDEDIEEWFWYTKHEFLHILADTSGDGKMKNRNVTLVREVNDLGFVPAWAATRPTFDGQRRGVFDQTIHILRTMHRLMTMTIYSTEEHAFPALSGYDVVNPQDYGPGAFIQLRSAEGRIDRMGPSAHFDVKDLIARLGQDADRQAVYPQQLAGEPGASIVSARGIGASMGALDARLAVAHKDFEVFFGKLCGFMLAVDEIYCPGDKTILGDYRDDAPAEKYNPERDVNGAWAARCTYGIGAGSDPANVEMRLSMHLANGLLSQETARQQLPFLEDPDAEPVLILREQMQMALVQGLLAQASQGDPSGAAEGLKLLRSDDLNFDEVMEKLLDIIAPEQPEQPGLPGGMDALGAAQGAESLARGGIPGSAEQAPQSLGLPPLGQLMGNPNQVI